MRSIRVLLLCITLVRCYSDTCDKDDLMCQDQAVNSVTDINTRLQQVEKLEKTNLNRAYEEMKSLYLSDPENPQVLFLMCKVQRALYAKLHVKMRDIGKPELLHPSIEHLKKILRMEKETVSDEFHAEVADFAMVTAMATTNKTLSVQLMEAALERKQNTVIGMDKYREMFEYLAEELFFAKEYSKAVDMIDVIRRMFKPPHMELNFIKAFIGRYNEVANNQPFVVSHDLLKKVNPKTDDDKRALVGFVTDIEQQLRAQKRNVEVDILFELSQELGMWPSKYQRPNMLLDGLRAQPVWTVEDSGYGAELGLIIHNWEAIRTEVLNLTEELEDWEWRSSPKYDKYDYYYFLGDGVVELPQRGCEIASTLCKVLRDFSVLRDCVLCEIKVMYFEPRGHYRPTVGPTNAKLTAMFPINHGNGTVNEGGVNPFKVRVGEDSVPWKVGEPAIIDGSFEHEIWNQLTRSRLMLFVDFKHPDMGPEDDFLDPELWDIREMEGQAVYQLKDAGAAMIGL